VPFCTSKKGSNSNPCAVAKCSVHEKKGFEFKLDSAFANWARGATQAPDYAAGKGGDRDPATHPAFDAGFLNQTPKAECDVGTIVTINLEG